MGEQRTLRDRQRPIQDDRGSTTISEAAVSRIAGMAVQEVEGIRVAEGIRRGSGTARTIEGFLYELDSATGGGAGRIRGISAEVGEKGCAIEISMAVEYGRSIPRLSEVVRRHVTSRVENLAGLEVAKLDISIYDVFLPPEG